ncbi:hypothetical protein Ais01nite_68520 [Asanoa ishikariensis]|nr:hypothetical protein Ais01nite_68520 [Asanoa ishikariensis]
MLPPETGPGPRGPVPARLAAHNRSGQPRTTVHCGPGTIYPPRSWQRSEASGPRRERRSGPPRARDRSWHLLLIALFFDKPYGRGNIPILPWYSLASLSVSEPT